MQEKGVETFHSCERGRRDEVCDNFCGFLSIKNIVLSI